MKQATMVPVEEYLTTDYSPDCEYVDGEVIERNVGERNHTIVQQELIALFREMRKSYGVSVWQEQRVQVGSGRFRVPDVCIYLGPGPITPIFREPPFLCIEILSAEDRMSRMLKKIRDYFAFGVSYVWVIDPQSRTASVHTPTGSQDVADGLLRTFGPDLTISLESALEGVI